MQYLEGLEERFGHPSKEFVVCFGVQHGDDALEAPTVPHIEPVRDQAGGVLWRGVALISSHAQDHGVTDSANIGESKQDNQTACRLLKKSRLQALELV